MRWFIGSLHGSVHYQMLLGPKDKGVPSVISL